MGRGNNHSFGCTCGWCTSTWKGGTGGQNRASYYAELSERWLNISPNLYHWKYRDNDFCRSTTCPICGASVFFVRHNGGSVWFDALGKPWPKHACFDNDAPQHTFSRGYYYRTANTTVTSHLKIIELMERMTEPLIGVVIEVTLSTNNSGHQIIIRCSNGQLLVAYVGMRVHALLLIGELVLVSKADKQMAVIDYNVILPIRSKPIPPPVNYALGGKYKHSTFGVGVLIAIEKENAYFCLTIQFEGGSIKRFDSRYVVLKYASS